MKRKTLAFAALAALSSLATAATGSFDVKALENSTSGGTGVSTFNLQPGYSFSISVDPMDLWNAGDLPRWSNANGLTGSDLTFSGSTDPQVAAWKGSITNGTVIGSNIFGTYTQGGLTAPFGTLVGQIGSGDFFTIGTSFSGVASSAGMLKLFYFDSNYGDNAGSIMAQVTAVPEPETYAMLLAGLGIVGAMARRRKQGTSAA